MKNHSKLFKVDSKGKIRVYFIEQEEGKYRMVTGIHEGKEVRSKWTVAKPKNVGKANATTSETQADAEIIARYTRKKSEGYFDSIEEAQENPEGRFFEPMLADTWEKVAAKYKIFPLLAAPKLDGMRMTILGKEAISRKGKDILTAGHIIEELEEFFINNPGVRLDGELYNHEYKEDFNTLMSIARQAKPTAEDLKIAREKLQFHVYDCYIQDDPKMPAYERKVWLMDNLPTLSSVKLVDYYLVTNQKALDEQKEQNLIDGYEGTITREPNSEYVNKRSRWLLKHKDFITEEFKVIDILAGKGNRSGIAGTVVVSVNGVVVGCGVKGTHEYAENLLKNKDNYIGKLATVRHCGETPDGSVRFPVCIDIDRPDL
jgi:ATP-dependent DNA ligase